jgi:hypothetical protein
MVNSEELIGTTEHLTLKVRCPTNQRCYSLVRLYLPVNMSEYDSQPYSDMTRWAVGYHLLSISISKIHSWARSLHSLSCRACRNGWLLVLLCRTPGTKAVETLTNHTNLNSVPRRYTLLTHSFTPGSLIFKWFPLRGFKLLTMEITAIHLDAMYSLL